jgi:hypothetical protein
VTSSGILGIVTKTLLSRMKKNEQRQKALELGVQALLRAEMIEQYEKYKAKCATPLYARDNYENMWVQYESLGANGVMSDIHSKFINLPVDK